MGPSRELKGRAKYARSWDWSVDFVVPRKDGEGQMFMFMLMLTVTIVWRGACDDFLWHCVRVVSL